MRHSRTRSWRWPIAGLAIVLVGVALFVTKLAMMRWITVGERPLHAVIAIDPGSEEVQWLSRKEWMFQAWVHNIRPGEIVPFHEHPRRNEMVVILRGRARVQGLRLGPSGGDPLLREEVLDAGNLVLSPARAVHQFENPTSEPLWCLVFMSRTFWGNRHLDGRPPPTRRDFLVLPWKQGGEPRGADQPAWSADFARTGQLDYFNSIPGLVRHDEKSLETSHPGRESWMVLLAGRGTLSIEGRDYEVTAPTWVYAPRSDWRLVSENGELVALEFQVPRFIARSFVLGIYDQYLSGRLGILP